MKAILKTNGREADSQEPIPEGSRSFDQLPMEVSVSKLQRKILKVPKFVNLMMPIPAQSKWSVLSFLFRSAFLEERFLRLEIDKCCVFLSIGT